jgi:hypothetical protein
MNLKEVYGIMISNVADKGYLAKMNRIFVEKRLLVP